MHSFISESFIECLLFVGHLARLCVGSNKRHTVAPGLVEAQENQQEHETPSDKCYMRGVCRQLRMHISRLEGVRKDSVTTVQ